SLVEGGRNVEGRRRGRVRGAAGSLRAFGRSQGPGHEGATRRQVQTHPSVQTEGPKVVGVFSVDTEGPGGWNVARDRVGPSTPPSSGLLRRPCRMYKGLPQFLLPGPPTACCPAGPCLLGPGATEAAGRCPRADTEGGGRERLRPAK